MKARIVLLAGALMALIVASNTHALALDTKSITTEDYQFAPDVLEVRMGDEIKITNLDDFEHNFTVTELHINKTIPPLSSTELRIGSGGGRTFKVTCTLHPGMEMEIIVGNPGKQVPMQIGHPQR